MPVFRLRSAQWDSRLRGSPDVTLRGAEYFTLVPSGIASAETFGLPGIVLAPYNVAPAAIPSGEAFGVTLLRSAVSPSGIATSEAFGIVVLGQFSLLQPDGIVSEEVFGVAKANLRLKLLGGIASAEGFGVPHLFAPVAPAGIPSGETFGNPILIPGRVVVLVQGIASEEAFGFSTVPEPNVNWVRPEDRLQNQFIAVVRQPFVVLIPAHGSIKLVQGVEPTV